MNRKENASWLFLPQEEETFDDLLLHGMKLLQSRSGYRFSLDSVLLAMWVALDNVNTAAELGTGNGVIALLLAARKPSLFLEGVEIQETLFNQAQRNIQNNRLTEQIRIIQGDIVQIENLLPKNAYDLVYSNPPFFRSGEGVLNPLPEKAIARHELLVTLPDVLKAAQYLVKPGGKLALILRAERLSEWIGYLNESKFSLSRLRFVHPRPGQPAVLFLAEAVKRSKASLKIESPLWIYQENGKYSEEILAWYGMQENE